MTVTATDYLCDDCGEPATTFVNITTPRPCCEACHAFVTEDDRIGLRIYVTDEEDKREVTRRWKSASQAGCTDGGRSVAEIIAHHEQFHPIVNDLMAGFKNWCDAVEPHADRDSLWVAYRSGAYFVSQWQMAKAAAFTQGFSEEQWEEIEAFAADPKGAPRRPATVSHQPSDIGVLADSAKDSDNVETKA